MDDTLHDDRLFSHGGIADANGLSQESNRCVRLALARRVDDAQPIAGPDLRANVDHLGQAQAVAPADGNYLPTDPQIAFHLARFIEDVRGLPTDGIVLRQDWLRAYDFTTDRGAAALNDYARTHDPFASLGKLQISVEVSSVIRASPASFRVAWIQRSYENGSLSATERWTAILTVVIDTPRDADRLRKNPLGVYVNAINWSKELGQ